MSKQIKLFTLVLVILSTFLLFPHPGFSQTPISYGDTVAGSISSPGEVDEFEFEGGAGDVITIRFAKTSGELVCYVKLFDPTGNPIGNSGSGVLNTTLASTGTFKITLRDYNNTNIGDYSLSLQRVNNPVGAIELSFGQTATGNIDAFAKIISYKFLANANDMLYISFGKLTQTSGYFEPYLELFDATGTKIAEAWTYSYTLTAKLNTTGEFYLLVTDSGRNGTGTYELTLQRSNNPANVITIDFGQTKSGSIGTVTDIDAYKFLANANDMLYISFGKLTQTSGDFKPYLELFDATGTRIAYSSGITGTLTKKVSTTGSFYLLVTDYYRDGTGTYELTLQRTNNPANVKELNYNSVKEDSIESVTKINAYRFTANANDRITICSKVKTATSGYFNPYLELFDTTGTQLASGVESIKYTFASGGTFYLFITDQSRDGTGSYNFILLSGDISCSTIDLTSPQVSLILPQAGEMIESGSTYRITWISSDNVGIASQEIRLSTDSGLTYPTVIASNLGPQVQYYDWEIPPDLFTAQARIKIIAWDALGNHGEDYNKGDFMIIKTALPPNAIELNYEYDKLYRLTKSASPYYFTYYSYDSLGNRLRLRKIGKAVTVAVP